MRDSIRSLLHPSLLRVLLLGVSVLVATPPLLAADPVPLTFAFQEHALTIDGAQPRARVYVYSVSREAKGDHVDVVPRETILEDADGDGRVAWTFEQPIALRSIWFAIDLSTGATASGAHPEFIARAVPFGEAHLGRAGWGDVTQLTFSGSGSDFIVVRPRQERNAIWRAAAGAEVLLDEDTLPGRSTVSAAKLTARGGTVESAPQRLRKGDVVFIVNSFRGEYTVGKVR